MTDDRLRNDRERMLAEGPRLAPEPRMAGDAVVPGPVADPGRSRRTTGPAVFPAVLRRVIPIGLFGLVFLADYARLGTYAWLAVVALIVVGPIVMRELRKRSR